MSPLVLYCLWLVLNEFIPLQLIKGISGGEKRRLSLAVQLISDPLVLFADEPLSGSSSSIILAKMVS